MYTWIYLNLKTTHFLIRLNLFTTARTLRYRNVDSWRGREAATEPRFPSMIKINFVSLCTFVGSGCFQLYSRKDIFILKLFRPRPTNLQSKTSVSLSKSVGTPGTAAWACGRTWAGGWLEIKLKLKIWHHPRWLKFNLTRYVNCAGRVHQSYASARHRRYAVGHRSHAHNFCYAQV